MTPSCDVLRALWRLSLAAVITICSVAFCLAQAESKLVEILDVQGNQSLSDKEILTLIETRAGEPYDKKKVKKDLERLLKSGRFDKVNTRTLIEDGLRGGVNVIFEIRELSKIESFVIHDFKTVKSKEILSHLRALALPVRKGDSFDPAKGRQTRDAISEFLAKKGFKETIVNFTVNEIGLSTVRIRIQITENISN